MNNSSQYNPSPDRFYILDGARFFAALCVLFYHYLASGPGNTSTPLDLQLVPTREFPELYSVFKFGFLGVNLFFLISGFVIFASASNRTAIQFAILRWIRLYPTYWTAIIFTTVIHYLYLGESYDISIRQFIANLTMLNHYLGIENIDPVYWTLQLELQFYICIFLLLLTGLFKHYKIWLSLWLFLCITYAATDHPFFLSWIISPKYSSLFISGIVFYIAKKQGYDPVLWLILILSYLLTMVVTPEQVTLYTKNTTTTDIITGNLVITLFYIFFYLISKHRLQIPRIKSLLLLGGITYPLYLIHLVAGRRLMDTLYGTVNSYLAVFVTIISILITATIMHITIDKKLCSILKAKLLSMSFFRNR